MLLARGFGTTSITPDVASGSGNISGSSSATKASVFWGATNAITNAGALVIATAVWIGGSTTVSSVTDTDGNAWTVLHSGGVNNGSACGCAIAWCQPLTRIPRNSGSYTITWNLSAAITTFNWQAYTWNVNGPVEPTVTAHGTNTGNSTAVSIASQNTPSAPVTSLWGSVFVAAWSSANTGTAGGSFTERYDGATGAGRFYGGTRQNLANSAAVAPAATIATAATTWATAACMFAHTKVIVPGRRTTLRSRPAVGASARV